MHKGMYSTRTRGRRINIPVIEDTSYKWTRFTKYSSINPPLKGRPKRVLKRFVDFGFRKTWWDEKVFEDLIVFGWDRGYLKSDAQILTLPFKYFLKDMNWTKRKRLKEVDENGF